MNKKTIQSITTVIVIIIPALIFGFMGKTAEMGLMVIASSISVAFLNINKVKSFKGGGFEAEMKEVIHEANLTIDTLKEMSKPLIVSTLNEINWSGRLGGIDQQQKHRLKNDIEAVINKFEIKDEKVNQALEEFYRYNTWDFYYYLKDEIFKSREITDQQREKLNSIIDRDSSNYPSKEFILKILNIDEKNLNSNEQKNLKDYLYYLKNHKLPILEKLNN